MVQISAEYHHVSDDNIIVGEAASVTMQDYKYITALAETVGMSAASRHVNVGDSIGISRQAAGLAIRNVAKRIAALAGRYIRFPTGQQAASFFFGVYSWLVNVLGQFSIIYFRGLGLRVGVRVWVRVRVGVRVWVRVRFRVRVRVSVVLWSV